MNKQNTSKPTVSISSKIRLVNIADSNLRAFADVTMNDSLTIKNVKIVEGKNGLFAAMPSVKDKNGYYEPVASLEKELYQQFSDLVVDDYKLVRDQAVEEQTADTSADIDAEPAFEQTM